MQNKILPPVAGDSTLYKKEALQYVRRHAPKKDRIPKRWVYFFIYCAANPRQIPPAFAADLLDKYAGAPDLAAGLLHFLRKKFSRLEKSKTGRLKKYIASTIAHKWQRGFGGKPDAGGYVFLRDLQDGEIAKAFEQSAGGCAVSIADTVKARKWVKKNQDAGKKFEQEVLDENEYLRGHRK